MLQHRARYHAGKHKYHQPYYPVLGKLPYGRFQVFLLARGHTCHLFKVLCILFLQNVHRVVNGDYAHKPFFVIHHGERYHVVFREQLCNFLPVVQRVRVDNICVHYVPNLGVRVGKQQLPYGHHAFKLLFARYHIACVYRFLIYARVAYHVKRLAHGKPRLQVHIFIRHQASGRILRIP